MTMDQRPRLTINPDCSIILVLNHLPELKMTEEQLQDALSHLYLNSTVNYHQVSLYQERFSDFTLELTGVNPDTEFSGYIVRLSHRHLYRDGWVDYETKMVRCFGSYLKALQLFYSLAKNPAITMLKYS